MIALCIVYCALQTSLVVFLLAREEVERREMLDRLTGKDKERSAAPVSPKGKLKKLLENWNARRAAKEIEDSERH